MFKHVLTPSHQIAAIAAAVAVFLLGTFGHDQWIRYEHEVARAARETSNATALLSEHAARTFQAAEEMLRAVADVRDDAAAGAARWNSATIDQRLQALQRASPFYLAIGWFDAEGNRVATSQSSEPAPLDIAAQENFRAQRDGIASGFYISTTSRSGVDGRPLINVSIPLRNANGGFAGIVGAVLDPIALAEVYQKFDLGPSQALALVRADGAYLARAPHLDSWIGRSVADSALFRDHLPRADSGRYRTVSAFDGVERIVSYARVPGQPLVAVASISRDDALAEFHRGLTRSGARLAAMIAALAVGAWLLAVQTRRRERAQSALLVSEAKFRDFAASSADWFWETDEQHRFVYLSDAIEKAIGRPPAWFYGRSREEIGYDGVSPEQTEEHQRTRRERRPFRDFEFQHRGPNGARWIKSSGVPVFDADGRFRGYRGTARDVTELRSAEERLRDAIEAIPAGFLLFDAEDCLRYVNQNNSGVVPEAAALYRIGDSFETVLRRTVAAGLADDAGTDPETWIAERVRRHRAAPGSTLVRIGRRLVEAVERPTHDGGVIMLRFDVTERERSKAALQASEVRFRDFAVSSGDWFWETDDQHRFVWMSDSVEKAIGVPAAWHYGKSRTELAAPGVAPEIWEEHERTLYERRPFRDFEYLRRGPTGDRWMRASGVPVFDEAGRFQGYRGSGRDVTGLRRAEQRLSDAVEAIPGGFLLFDAQDRLVYVNRNNADVVTAVADLHRIGDTFENLLRRTVAAGLVDDAAADPEAWIAERLRRHRAAGGATLVRNAGRTIETIEQPTHDGGTVMLRFDVTERENAAEAQRQASAAAEAANLAKSDFLSRMSHELRTPLNAVIGFAQMLQFDRSQSLTASQKECSDFILKGGQHLLNLVNEVLDLAGIEAGRLKLSPERVSVSNVISQAVETMRPVAVTAGIALRREIDPTTPDVHADLQRLRQVLLNLLSNAIKYNRPDGAVTVTATTMDGRARLVVTDTGIGIAPEQEAQLFEPFHRLGAEHTAVEGTGIGLALSKKLIEAMDGHIGYSTKLGEGSSFWIELPAEGHAVPTHETVVRADSALAVAGGYSLLYVEDNPANLRLMEHLVGTLPDVTMLSAPAGPLGLELAQGHRPDVIILDLNLPGMSGYEVLKRLKAMPETRDTPVIALTAAAMPADERRGLAAGFYRYVTKPLDVNSFLATVSAALARSRSGSIPATGQAHSATGLECRP